MESRERHSLSAHHQRHTASKEQPASTNQGSSMDRKIANPSLMNWRNITIVAALIVITLLYLSADIRSGHALNVNGERLVIAAVTQGNFEDFIPLRGRVVPNKTLYLDVTEGGRVERVLVENGSLVKAGDLIVELSNASLQLSVLSNEARVAEQLNNIRSIELSLEQNRLQHKHNLTDIRYQIKKLSRQVDGERKLIATNAISLQQFNDTLDTLNWYEERLALTLESQASDARMQETQLSFLHETGRRLQSNLEISRKNMENMNVRAPVDGKLSGFNIAVGQSIREGERLGQLDTPNNYKVSAHIDEFYLSRIDMAQMASFGDFNLRVSKIYPQVQNGQFQVDFTFVDTQPQDIRRGQSVQLKLSLGDTQTALMVPNGPFLQETGGNWVFVVDKANAIATKRAVRLGRRNTQFVEVLEGLTNGERIVTSPYDNYRKIDTLTLSNI